MPKNYHKTIKDVVTMAVKSIHGKYNNELYKLMTKVFKEYLVFITDNIMSSQVYKVPMRLGYIFITKNKSPFKAIDWVNTHKYKKAIYFPNYHTDGHVYRWTWAKTNDYAIFTNKTLYMFKPARPIQRKFAKILKSEYIEFSTWNS